MKVTVITVSYNEKQRIGATIESVLNQDYSLIDYLIIDGNSTDGTLEVINRYQEKNKNIRVKSERDFGIYNAMNKGINMAEGSYINFMNAGDVFADETVVSDMVRMAKKTDADIIYGRTRYFDSRGKYMGSCAVQERAGKGTWNLLNIMPCHQSIFAKTECLRNHYFREKYRILADYEWFLECYKQKKRIVFSDKDYCQFYRDGISASNRYRKLADKEKLDIIREKFPLRYFFLKTTGVY